MILWLAAVVFVLLLVVWAVRDLVVERRRRAPVVHIESRRSRS